MLHHGRSGLLTGFHEEDLGPCRTGPRQQAIAIGLGNHRCHLRRYRPITHADVADLRRARIAAAIDGFGIDSAKAIGKNPGLAQLQRAAVQRIQDVVGGTTSADAGVGHRKSGVTERQGAGIVVAALLEIRGVDGVVVPHFLVGIGGHPLLATAELVALGGLLLFPPLVHLDRAPQHQRRGFDPEIRIAHTLIAAHLGAEVNQLAVHGGVNRVCGHALHRLTCCPQALVVLERAVLVPGQQQQSRNDDDKRQQKADEGLLQPAPPGDVLADYDGHDSPSVAQMMLPFGKQGSNVKRKRSTRQKRRSWDPLSKFREPRCESKSLTARRSPKVVADTRKRRTATSQQRFGRRPFQVGPVGHQRRQPPRP